MNLLLIKNEDCQQEEVSMNKSTQVSDDHFTNLAVIATTTNKNQQNLMNKCHNKTMINNQTKITKTINDYRFESCRNVITSSRKLSMNNIERRCHDFLQSSIILVLSLFHYH